jgi:VCBS repeat-containing protein
MDGSLTPTKFEEEFRVNVQTRNDQQLESAPGSYALAALADGGFVAVFTDANGGRHVVAQRYDAFGVPVGDPFTPGPNTQNSASVAGLPDGGFVIAWIAPGEDVFVRRFDAAGDPVGDAEAVNTFTGGRQWYPAVAVQPDGSYMVVWASEPSQDGSQHGSFGRIWRADGTVTPEFQLNTFTLGEQDMPTVTAMRGGGYFTSWMSYAQDLDIWGVYGQVFNDAGERVGDEFRISTSTKGEQLWTASAALLNGDVVVVWQSDVAAPGGGRGIYGQVFSPDGVKVGAEFRVTTTVAPGEWAPVVTELQDGGFLVGWFAPDGEPTDGFGVFAQRFAADGTRAGDQLRINTHLPGDQRDLFLETLADGSVVAIWESMHGAPQDAQDGSGAGVFGQRLLIPGDGQPPEAERDIAHVMRATGPVTIDVLANDEGYGVGSSILSIDATGLVGTARIVDNQIRYDVGTGFATLTAGQTATTSFSYVMEDGEGNQSRASVTIVVHGRELMARVGVTVAENTVSDVFLFDVDSVTAPVFAVVGGRDGDSFRIDSAGRLYFIDAPDFEAPGDVGADNIYNVNLSATADGATLFQAVAVRVTDRAYENAAPVFTSGNSGTIAENATGLVYTAAATDTTGIGGAGSPTLTYGLSGADATHFAIDGATGALTLVTARDFEAPTDENGNNTYRLIVSASDGEFTATQTVTITVTDVYENRAPVFTSVSHVNYGELRTDAPIVVKAVDDGGPDGYGAVTISYTLGGADADLFALDAGTGRLTFLAQPDYEAPADADGDNLYRLTVTATGGGLSSTQDLSIAVLDRNLAPTITSASAITVRENATGVVFTPTAIDTEPAANQTAALRWELRGVDVEQLTDVEKLRIDNATGAISFATAPNFETPADWNRDNVYKFTIWVSDGANFSTQAVTLTVGDIDEQPPVLTSGATASAEENTAGTVYTITAEDPNTANLVYSISGTDAAAFVVDSATGAVRFAAPADYEAPGDADGDNVYDITVSAADADTTVGRDVAITVTNYNDQRPVITSGATATADERDTGAVYTATATDSDSASILWSLSGDDARHFTLGAGNGALRFTGISNYEALADADKDNVYEVVITASDGTLTASKAVSITLRDINLPPVITSPAAVAFGENLTQVAYNATATDEENIGTGSLAWSLGGTDAARFTIDASTGAVRFRNAPDYEAPTDANRDNIYAITVIATDGVATVEKAVRIQVADAYENVAPRITSAATATFQENGLGIAYQATATDTGGVSGYGTVTFRWTLAGADAGLFNLDAATGAVTFKAAPNYEAPADADGDNAYEVVVATTDGAFPVSQAVTITVTDLDIGPVVTSGAFAITQAGHAGAVYAAASENPEGPAVTYALGGADAALFAIDSVTGVVSFLAPPARGVPPDADGDGSYDIIVTASDGTRSGSREVSVLLSDLVDGTGQVVPFDAGGIVLASTTSSGGRQEAQAGTPVLSPDGTKLLFSSQAQAFGPVTGFHIYMKDLLTGEVTRVDSASDGTPSNGEIGLAYAFSPDGRSIAFVSDGSNLVAGDDNGMHDVFIKDLQTGTLRRIDVADHDPTGLLGIEGSPTVAYGARDVVFSADGTRIGYSYVDALDGAGTTAQQAIAIDLASGQSTVVSSAADGSLADEASTDPSILMSASGRFANRFIEFSPDGTQAYFLSAASDLVPSDDHDNYNVYRKDLATGAVTRITDYRNAAGSQASVYMADLSADGRYLVYNLIQEDPTRSQGADPGRPGDTAAFDIYRQDLQTGDVVKLTQMADGTAANGASWLSQHWASGLSADGQTLVFVTQARNLLPATPDNLYALGGGAVVALDIPSGTFTLVSSNAEGLLGRRGDNPADFAAGNWSPTISGDGRIVAFSSDASNLIPGDLGRGAGLNDVFIKVIEPRADLTMAVNDTAAARENNQRVVIDVLDNDPLSGTSLLMLDTDGLVGTASIVGGVVEYRAGRNIPGLAFLETLETGFSYITVDASGTQRSATVAITITGVNDAPIFTSAGTATFDENGTGTVLVAAAPDPDDEAVTYALSGADAALFEIDSVTGAIGFRAAPDFEAPGDADGDNVYDILVTATDGSLSTSQAVAITVADVNLAPTITGAEPAEFAENATGIVLTAIGVDPENLRGGATTWALSGGDAALFAIDSVTGAVSFLATPDYEAPGDADGDNVYDIVVTLSDGQLSDSRAVAVTVTDVYENIAPAITSAATADFAEAGSGVAYAATATDTGDAAGPGAVPLAWTLSGTDAALFDIDAATGEVTFRTTPDYEAPADAGADNVYDIVVTASDGVLESSLAVAITVTDVDQAPVFTSGFTGWVPETTRRIAYDAAATDPDGRPVTFALSGTDAAFFRINATTGVVSFLTPPNFEARADADADNVYDIVVTASDGTQTTSRAVAISVLDIADTIPGSDDADSLIGGVRADTLLGLGGNDTILAGAGDDRLDGGTGADSMAGGAGNDSYDVDDAGDMMVEAANGGARDSVWSTISLTLADYVENLVLVGGGARNGTGNAQDNSIDGNAAANLLQGGDGADTLIGRGGADSLLGEAGDDRLEGGAGADSMVGGTGDDTYLVDSADDVVVEAAGEGDDLVLLAVDWTLAAGVERAQARGGTARAVTGNELANHISSGGAADTLEGGDGADTLVSFAGDDVLSGGAQDDRLDGGRGADTLDGGDGDDLLAGGLEADLLDAGAGDDRLDGQGGADTMAGGDGDDAYVVDDAGDVVVELAGGGQDVVVTTVDWTVAAEVERIVVSGSAGLAVQGNALANFMVGAAGADSIAGGAGDDRIIGNAGEDTLISDGGRDILSGGADADAFRLLDAIGAADLITGYRGAEDRIEVSAAVFGIALAPGEDLVAAGLAIDSATGLATSAAGTGQFVWQAATGTLFWDADGEGAAARVALAQFTDVLGMAASELVLIA